MANYVYNFDASFDPHKDREMTGDEWELYMGEWLRREVEKLGGTLVITPKSRSAEAEAAELDWDGKGVDYIITFPAGTAYENEAVFFFDGTKSCEVKIERHKGRRLTTGVVSGGLIRRWARISDKILDLLERGEETWELLCRGVADGSI